MAEESQADYWDYTDCRSATLHEKCCPTCGQEVEGEILKGSLWHQMVMLAVHAQTSEQLARILNQRERKGGAEVRAHINQRSTYRVQKSLLAKCLAAGVPLLDERGKPRGKTAIEAELRRIQATNRMAA